MPRCPRCHRRLATGAACPDDGGRGDAPADPPAGEPPPIAGLAVTEVLGAGGFATVFAARRDDGLAVALKVAHAATGLARERCARERDALLAIGPPYVPALIDGGVLDDGRPYLVLERLSGTTLAGALAAMAAPPAVDRAVRLAAEIVATIDAAHRRGWVHRDVKPENVFLTDTGPRLLDFGLVRGPNAAELTAAGAVLGTPEYVAPEVLRGAMPGTAADLYALGVVVHELLSLRAPFTGDRATIVRGHMLRRPPRLPGVPAALQQLVDELLAKDPARRPSAAELRPRLVAAVGPVSSVTGAAAVAPRGRRRAVVLWLDAEAGALEVDAACREHDGFVAREWGRRRACVFTDAGRDPVARAIAAAERLLRRSSGCGALHLARIAVRGDELRPVATGAALDRPASWLPATPWSGLVLTAEAVSSLGAELRATPAAVAGFFALAEPVASVDDTPLFDRDAILEAAARAEAAARDGAASLLMVLGAPGTGKSRVARAIAAGLAMPTSLLVAGRGGRPVLAELGLGDCPDARALARGLRAREPLAIVIDDADAIDQRTLDALELATLGHDRAALCVCLIGDPRLLRGRAAWGDRAGHREVVELAPLPPDAARALAAHLLLPATRVPGTVLARLAADTHGNPQQLVELVRHLAREGLVRRFPGGDDHYVAADLLDRVPPVPSAVWLAGRELAALPLELADLARLAAVAGPDVADGELEELQRALDGDPAALGLDADVGAGLRELEGRGLLVAAGAQLRFRTEALRDAIAAEVEPARRAAVHAVLFESWRARPEADEARLARVAHHGAEAGQRGEAVEALLALAAEAEARHAQLDAEALLGRALELISDDTGPVRLEALRRRGAVRRLLTHYEDARADFQAAVQLAEGLGDRAALVDLLVSESAVCDFTEQLGEAAALVERARVLAGDDLPPRTQARLWNWLGVARAREGRLAEAVELLGRAVALAEALGDHETLVGSLLMLGPATLASRPGDALANLDRAVELCERAGDPFHLAVGLINRVEAWRERGDLARASADGERLVRIAYEMGYGQLEIFGSYNLCLVHLWSGDVDAAVTCARRAHELSVQRFRDRRVAIGSLGLALLCAQRGRLDEARDVVARVPEADADRHPGLRRLRRAVTLAVDRSPPAAWRELCEEARRETSNQERVQLLWVAAHAVARAGEPAEAAALLAEAAAEARRAGGPVADVLDAERRQIVEESCATAR